jgi:hypothetical protein
MLALIGILLIILWVIGLVVHIAGGFIHLLLVVAAILIVLHFLRGKWRGRLTHKPIRGGIVFAERRGDYEACIQNKGKAGQVAVAAQR